MRDGSITNPATLAQVLTATSRIQPGHTVYLRGGTYTFGTGKETLDCHLQGNAQNQIVIRPYPGESVRINGGLAFLAASCNYVTLRGVEIAPTPTTRTFATESDFPVGVNLTGTGNKIINCIIHDCTEGISWYGSGIGEVYGCLFYNNGNYYNSGADYAIYTHNNSGGARTVKHNIFAVSFAGYGFHGHSGGNKVQDYTLSQNIFTQSSLLFDSGSEGKNNTVDQNIIFDGGVIVGSADSGKNKTIVVTNNHIYNVNTDCVKVNYLPDVTVTDNTMTYAPGVGYLISSLFTPTGGFTSLAWDRNTYHHPVPAHLHDMGLDAIEYFWAGWQGLGYDASGTFDKIIPASNVTAVYANQYADADDQRVGIVAIINYENLSSVSVDLSSLSLTNGTYRWRQAQDPYSDTATLSYTGSPVSFPMTGHTVATPTAYSSALASTTFPNFGAFLIEK